MGISTSLSLTSLKAEVSRAFYNESVRAAPGMEGAETRRQRACPSCPCVWILGMKPCAALAARLLSASCPSSATNAPASCPSNIRAASAASPAPPCVVFSRLIFAPRVAQGGIPRVQLILRPHFRSTLPSAPLKCVCRLCRLTRAALCMFLQLYQ